MLQEQLPRPRPIMGPEHEWERERIHLELEELTENVREALEESQTLLRGAKPQIAARGAVGWLSVGRHPCQEMEYGARVHLNTFGESEAYDISATADEYFLTRAMRLIATNVTAPERIDRMLPACI